MSSASSFPNCARGDIVVMDNLSSHRRTMTRQRIEAASAILLYLPYSPDFNPRTLSQAQGALARLPSEPSMVCGPPPDAWSTSSHLPNAETTLPPDTMQHDRPSL
jgi:hypothetical protein